MTSKLVKKKNTYCCSNCMMRQPHLATNCWWCGNLFSNYEEIIIENAIEEEKINESNVYRKN